MQVIVVHKIGDREVQFRELKVSEIRAWLARWKDSGAQDFAAEAMLNLMLSEEMALDDIPHMTSLTPADIEDMTPSEIKRVIGHIREVNPDFFEMRSRLANLARSVIGMADSPTSNEALPA